MITKIQSIHFDADQKLLDHIESTLQKLPHYFEHIQSTEVFLKLEKSEEHHNKIVEIKTEIPGKPLFAESRNKSFESAFDTAFDNIREQVKREKEKARGL